MAMWIPITPLVSVGLFLPYSCSLLFTSPLQLYKPHLISNVVTRSYIQKLLSKRSKSVNSILLSFQLLYWKSVLPNGMNLFISKNINLLSLKFEFLPLWLFYIECLQNFILRKLLSWKSCWGFFFWAYF